MVALFPFRSISPLTVTAPVPNPKVAVLLPNCTVPAATVRPPLKVLAASKISRPAPR